MGTAPLPETVQCQFNPPPPVSSQHLDSPRKPQSGTKQSLGKKKVRRPRERVANVRESHSTSQAHGPSHTKHEVVKRLQRILFLRSSPPCSPS